VSWRSEVGDVGELVVFSLPGLYVVLGQSLHGFEQFTNHFHVHNLILGCLTSCFPYVFSPLNLMRMLMCQYIPIISNMTFHIHPHLAENSPSITTILPSHSKQHKHYLSTFQSNPSHRTPKTPDVPYAPERIVNMLRIYLPPEAPDLFYKE
jgi:hypothetical protein